jgi:hypothetical protein
MPATIRSRTGLRAAVLGLFVLPLMACGDVVIPQTLVLEQPSEISLTVDVIDPPETYTTSLVGGIESTITASLGLFEVLGALVGVPLVADVSVDNIAIAGTEINFLGLLPTGTICVSLDELNPGGGEAYINPLLGVAQFLIDLNTVISITNEVVGGILGGPLPFAATIDSIVPLTLGDLIGLILGDSGGISLTQEIDTTIPEDVAIIGGAPISATLTLASADALPSGNALLEECDAFLNGP